MKALVKFAEGREGMGIREVPIPEPKEGELKVKVVAAGICGSDLHSMLDERKTIMPVILGHEYVGIVEDTCGDVGDFKKGDYVVSLPASGGCGVCKFCQDGEVTMCPQRRSIGTHMDGAMAEYVIIPHKFAFKVPEEIEDKVAFAAIEPLACTVRGIKERIKVNPGDVAVVSGPGTLGLFSVQVLKACGAYVIVSGLPQDEHRLKKALELGADEIVDNYADLEKAVKAKNPLGADVVLETSGVAPSLTNTCLEIIKVHGTLLQIGLYGKPITVNLDRMFDKEIYYVPTNSTAMSTWAITLDMIKKGELKLSPLISLRMPLEKWEEAFDAVINKTAFKVILTP